MRTSLSITTAVSAVGLSAALLLSGCATKAANNSQASADVAPAQAPKKAATPAAPVKAAPPSYKAGVVPAGWTPSMPLTGGVFKCENGLIAATFECKGVEVLSYLPIDSMGKAAGTDAWGWHDTTTGREFLVIGGTGTSFIEVTDPTNPKYLGVLQPHAGRGGTQSVKVYKHYAYIGYEAGNYGIQVFDLSQLRDLKGPPATFQETAFYDSLRNTHTLSLNQETGYAYVNGSNTCGAGLHIIDIRTPLQPKKVGCWPETLGGTRTRGYIHDAHCLTYRGPDQQYKGREICVNYAEKGVGIVDVTDKQNLKLISSFTYPGASYTHQGWFTEDQRYIFINDEADEGGGKNTRTIGFDLADLDQPVGLPDYMHSTTVTDHNLYIKGRYMYQGNYGAGLRVIDVGDPKNLKEVGYLTKIGQAWGTYPFFKNDVVAVSIMGKGMILARLAPEVMAAR